MNDVYAYAKYLLKKGADSTPNTFDGNMKLQKLLVFADFVNIVQNDEPLFDDEVLAFENGCVIEKVRIRYKEDYQGLKEDSDRFEPDFTDKEYDTLNLTLNVFGQASAKELSSINHTFSFWKTAFENGTTETGYHDKTKSVVNMLSDRSDIDRMKNIIEAYRESEKDVTAREVINGVTFYYDGFTLTDGMIDELERFSRNAEDSDYSVYLDEGKMVVY